MNKAPTDVLHQLASRFEGHVASEAIEYADASTRAAMRRPGSGHWTDHRIAAYFKAVVRRRVLRNHSASTAVTRMITESIVEDLLGTGRSASDVFEELARGWGDTLPEPLLAEYRQRLCA